MSHRSRLLLALASTCLIGYIAVGALLGRALGDTSFGQLAIFNEVVRLVLDAYVEPVNLDRAMAGARLGMADALDGDSSYLDAEQYAMLQQPVNDADAEIGLVLTRRFSFVMVVTARPGSPAAKAGLQPGDLVKAIDERHTKPMAALVAERLLRGAPGSSVKLSVLRAGADPFDVTVVREKLRPAAVQGRMLEDATGYVKVSDFTPTTGDDVRAQVETLKRSGAARLLLDVRDAAWGSPADGAKVAEVFLQGGPVAKLVGRRTDEKLLQADASHNAWSGPLAVLVTNGTAGPGEIVAAALVDAGRAKLVGEHTFGRAAISKTITLPEGALVVTVAKYMSPKGTSIHGQGLAPTVPVSQEDEDADTPEGAAKPDRILEKGLEVLKAEAHRPRRPRRSAPSARRPRIVPSRSTCRPAIVRPAKSWDCSRRRAPSTNAVGFPGFHPELFASLEREDHDVVGVRSACSSRNRRGTCRSGATIRPTARSRSRSVALAPRCHRPAANRGFASSCRLEWS